MTENTAAPNRILCPYCKRLITLLSIDYGSTEKCPHCELDFVVSHRLLPQDSVVSAEDEEEEYVLQTQKPPSVPGDDLLSDAGVPKKSAAAAEVEKEPPTWRPMQTPPMEIFLKGTFTFPFRAGSHGWILILLLLSLAVGASASTALHLFNFPASDITYVGHAWFVSAFLCSATLFLGMGFLFTLSAIGLAILRDTSEGNDNLVDQPQGLFTEWIEETVYILVNLFFGALPALILFTVLPDRPAINLPVIFFTETILFPVFLLSAMESKSPVTFFSKPVWRSLWYAWHAWVLFYLFTLLFGEALVYFRRLIPSGSIWTDIVYISILLPFFWIVYFRLLGRMALFCSGRYNEMHPPKEKS